MTVSFSLAVFLTLIAPSRADGAGAARVGRAQSHNAMEVYQDVKDFATAQLVSTRNIHFGLFNDWFAGGLNLQVRAGSPTPLE